MNRLMDLLLSSWLTSDLVPTVLLLGAAGLVALAYLVRVAIRGKAHFRRIDKQGGSALLSKDVMEGAYWFFQPLARLLVTVGVTPNQISWTSLGFGFVASACLAVGHFGSGACFAAVSMLLDALDGIVARETGLSSDAGEVLDASIDRYVEFFFIAGLVIYYREIPALMVLALLTLAGSFMVSYSSAQAEAMQVEPPKGSMRRPERAVYLILGAALSPVTIPWFEASRDYPIAIGHPMVIALGLVAVMANVSAIERLWVVAKVIRVREAELKASTANEARRQAEIKARETLEDEHSQEAHHPVRPR